jgi:hypothetical protein
MKRHNTYSHALASCDRDCDPPVCHTAQLHQALVGVTVSEGAPPGEVTSLNGWERDNADNRQTDV